MAIMGLRSVVVRKYRYYTKSAVTEERKNILNQDFTAATVNQKWCTDITYIHSVNDGWTYLASVMDFYSKKIIGWSFSKKMTTELALKAVQNACLNVKDTEGIILHSDLGSQYTSAQFEEYLKSKGIKHSFSRKGCPYDNACILYNIFNEFLEDISEDILPNEATGFKESKIWNMLYNFQKDAALAIINKLEKYNGCILADSVGLGKTFTALAVIKYYETRNKTVLVLCSKKLGNNWNTYRDNYVNNPLSDDRLNYKVLYHTDLGRSSGESNGTDLSRLRWETYDLVVIDESHNFRNGGKISGEDNEKENRYLKLINRVIRKGVRTNAISFLSGNILL